MDLYIDVLLKNSLFNPLWECQVAVCGYGCFKSNAALSCQCMRCCLEFTDSDYIVHCSKGASSENSSVLLYQDFYIGLHMSLFPGSCVMLLLCEGWHLADIPISLWVILTKAAVDRMLWAVPWQNCVYCWGCLYMECCNGFVSWQYVCLKTG